MADLEKAMDHLIKAVEAYKSGDSAGCEEQILWAKEAMNQERTGSFWVEDSTSMTMEWGSDSRTDFVTIEDARKFISYCFDVYSRVHYPFFTIWQGGVFIERVDREPEDG